MQRDSSFIQQKGEYLWQEFNWMMHSLNNLLFGLY